MKWKKEFINTKTTNYYQATVKAVVQFMKQKKQNVDLENKQHKKKDTHFQCCNNTSMQFVHYGNNTLQNLNGNNNNSTNSHYGNNALQNQILAIRNFTMEIQYTKLIKNIYSFYLNLCPSHHSYFGRQVIVKKSNLDNK